MADGQATDDARWRGGTESRCDGKHVGVQERASACSLRGLVPRPSGTAVDGPIRTVVWDPWLALAVTSGDPILLLLILPRNYQTRSVTVDFRPRRRELAEF